ncbi:MAG: NAD(P)H-quinone oxidoreductase [Betaproteobacteria bacterium]|jgi:NADPH2:quinone reductase|nr:NAD(P)H-quinone oxidoreductase [Betaproteobacteria bacterium]MDH4292874.1 NAD(P)H-quinone oxidoreductase [Betaproteobacteria bacterium]
MNNPLPVTMRAIEISAPGGPEVLKPVERPLPEIKDHEVLIKVTAAGINGPDIMQRKGLYPAPAGASDLPGLEVSGTIVAKGKNVQRWSTGDKIVALTNGGGYAEYVAADATHCLTVPQGISMLDAAGLPETFFTVWSNVFIGAGLKAGETFLVHGGAGGIGTTCIQLGKAFGAKVIATDSPESRCSICKELGADRVVDYVSEDFVEIVRAAGGANVILDIVGGPNIEKNFKAASHDARIIQLAFGAGSKVEVNLMPVMLKRLTYTGSTLRTRPDAFKARIARELEEQVWPLIAAGKIRTVTHSALPLDQAAQAHALMQSSQHVGKILLEIA